jgi:YesN/AraC family two-component response regulator
MNSVDKNRLSVLIVDDEAFQRRILREVLRNLDFTKIKEADSGQFAVVAMTEQNFDLVLSDVQMPGMNGLELLRKIRTGQTQLARDARFIVLTSFSNTEVLGAAMALDVNGFLAKPIRIGVVMEKIDRAVQETFQLRAPDDYEGVVTSLPSLEEARQQATGVRHAPAEKIAAGANEKAIPIMQLRVGMCVTKALVASDGTLLIPAGTVLTQLFINRLWDLSSVLTDELVHITSTPRGESKAPESA